MEITKQTSTQDIHTKKRKESKHNAKDMVKSKRQRKEQKKGHKNNPKTLNKMAVSTNLSNYFKYKSTRYSNQKTQSC